MNNASKARLNSKERQDERINTVVSQKSEGDLLHVEFEYDIGMFEDNNGYADYSGLAHAHIRESSKGYTNTFEGMLELNPKGQELTREEEKNRSLLTKMLSGNWEDKLYSFGGFTLHNGRLEMNRIVESDQLDQAEQTVEDNLRSIVTNIADELNYETRIEKY